MLRLIIATIEEMNSFPPRARPGLSGSSSPETTSVPAHLIAGRRVLITGAGGSIGSALAHAIAGHHPAQILLLDASEQALYQIDRRIAAPHESILASVCDAPALEEAFDRFRPHIVFHAAAFKHVPLLELHPFAALQNNAVGTFALAQTAIRHSAEQVIVVSTDKAADPAGIMGASKRIAELAALALHTPAVRIKAVRLGNVYASQGSAVPLFQEQIAQGGPVTVTHPDATRYFLTLEQAAALLLFALSEEFPSAVLIPEISSPIRIADIARALIEQSGSPAQIVYTGLRPGEKLHEQFLSATEHRIAECCIDQRAAPLHAIQSEQLSAAEAAQAIEQLRSAIQERSLDRLLRTVTRLVPAYTPGRTLLESQAAAAGESRA